MTDAITTRTCQRQTQNGRGPPQGAPLSALIHSAPHSGLSAAPATVGECALHGSGVHGGLGLARPVLPSRPGRLAPRSHARCHTVSSHVRPVHARQTSLRFEQRTPGAAMRRIVSLGRRTHVDVVRPRASGVPLSVLASRREVRLPRPARLARVVDNSALYAVPFRLGVLP